MQIRIWTATAVGLVLLGLGGAASADEKMIGNLSAVDVAAKTISVQETGSTDAKTFAVDDKTVIREGRKEVKLSTLQPGREVKVGFVDKDGVALARRVDISVPLGADRSEPMPIRVDSTR